MVNVMNVEYLNKVPEWYKSNEKFDLVLSDDIDSLTTVAVVQSVHPNWNVEYFYDFDNIYASPDAYFKENKSRTRVWCDVAFCRNEMAFDNHISRKDIDDHVNPRCINPNILASVSNYGYTNKYAGSTALLVWSLYNIPLPKTEEGKMMLLCIDSTFKGFYSSTFKERNRFFLCDVLDLPELYEVEKRHDIKEFYQLMDKYGLSQKIRYNSETKQIESKLDVATISEKLGIDISLPTKQYDHWRSFEQKQVNMCGVKSINVMAKMSDSIYVNVMNPMPVAIGQRIESSIPADAVGYVMNLDVGDFKYANCSLDYNSIKLYLDNMKQFLNDVACMPSVLGSSTNIANISEVSMQILLMMASVYADENKKWLNIGFQKRFEMFKKILGMQGIKVDSDVEVIYNVAMPVASTEMIANLKALQEMGAISKETIMEKTEYVSDVEVEKKRLSGENVSQDVSQKVDNPSKEVEIE